MPPRPIREIKTDTAKELAEIYSVQQDLERIIIWLGILIEALSNPVTQQEAKGLESLWMAALVFYARCFKGGIRKRLDPVIYNGLPGEPLVLHKWLLDLRDKRIAHSVSSYEQYTTGLLISEVNGELKVDGVMASQIGHSFPKMEDCKMIQSLVAIAHKYADGEVKKLMTAVKTESEKLSQDELKKLKTVRFDTPSPEQAAQRR